MEHRKGLHKPTSNEIFGAPVSPGFGPTMVETKMVAGVPPGAGVGGVVGHLNNTCGAARIPVFF